MKVCFTSLFFLLSFYIGSAQILQDSTYFSSLISQVGEIPEIKVNTKKITVPIAPAGFKLQFSGSDNQQVIDNDGNIHTPLVSTWVNLYFQLSGASIDTVLDITDKSVLIPGKYKDEGKNKKPAVIPALREWYGYEGMFELQKNISIVIDPKDKDTLQKIAKIFQNDLLLSTGIKPTIKTGKPQPGDIFLTLQEKDKSIGDEGYYLNVDKFISISALQYKGLFWGTRTILQILEQDPNHKSLPKGITRDYPKYEVRGFMIDVGRKFFTIDFLRDYVKLMSYYKMNNFQIHLNDNGFDKYFQKDWNKTYAAFRLENTTYPNLTAKDGSYSKREFIELQKLANDYAVTVIPEIDVPAHSLSFAHAIPEIGSKGYGMDHLDLHNPLTYEVVENVFKEYLQGTDPVFINKEVHIGTDEYNKKESEAFRAFTDHFIRYVQKFGKDVRIWGALTHAQGKTPVTSENVTMNAWYNGYADPKEMKKQGYKLVSTPDGYLYIVPAAGYYYDYLNIKMLFDNWEPINVGKVRFAPGDTTIRGGMFAVWNDIVGNGITMKDVNDRVFPAIQVLAQKMWMGKDEKPDYEKFHELTAKTGEGPGINIRGKLPANNQNLVFTCDFEKIENSAINVSLLKGYTGNAIWLKGGSSYYQLPFVEAGFDYTVSFRINPDENIPGSILFSSPNAIVKIMDNGKLGFSQEQYDNDFDYTLPEKEWTHITITGTNKGTSLYVNGKLYKKLYDGLIFWEGVEKPNKKMQTLFFPLKCIGDKKNAFKGGIDDISIYNIAFDEEKIQQLSKK